jgi:hypothetical protein
MFAPAQQVPIPEWPCTLTRRQQPSLTLKDNDLFLITDTLGNIAGCQDEPIASSLGLFCRDTRFLSRLELQFEGSRRSYSAARPSEALPCRPSVPTPTSLKWAIVRRFEPKPSASSGIWYCRGAV